MSDDYHEDLKKLREIQNEIDRIDKEIAALTAQSQAIEKLINDALAISDPTPDILNLQREREDLNKKINLFETKKKIVSKKTGDFDADRIYKLEKFDKMLQDFKTLGKKLDKVAAEYNTHVLAAEKIAKENFQNFQRMAKDWQILMELRHQLGLDEDLTADFKYNLIDEWNLITQTYSLWLYLDKIPEIRDKFTSRNIRNGELVEE